MSEPRSITAIVLAGGESSRFGGDKLAAELDGAPVLHHVLRAVAGVAVKIVLVLAPDTPVPPLPRELAGRTVVARDAVRHAGPLAAVAAGLASIHDDAPRIAIVVGGDMPWVVPAVLRLLADRLGSDASLAAMTLDAAPPTPLPLALRPERAREAIATCLAGSRRSLRSLLEAAPSAMLPAADWRALDPGGATLRDVDVPDDLRR